jgi:hypothetical protein
VTTVFLLLGRVAFFCHDPNLPLGAAPCGTCPANSTETYARPDGSDPC